MVHTMIMPIDRFGNIECRLFITGAAAAADNSAERITIPKVSPGGRGKASDKLKLTARCYATRSHPQILQQLKALRSKLSVKPFAPNEL